jgi:hypothetical protein
MHFEQGKDAPRAVRYSAARGRKRTTSIGASRSRGPGATRPVRARDSAVHPERDQQELSLRIVLGVSVMALKGFAADEVRDIFQRAIDLGGAEDSSPQASWRIGCSACFHYFRAEIQRSHTIASQLVDRAQRLASPLLSSEATCALGVTFVEMASSTRRAIISTHCGRCVRGTPIARRAHLPDRTPP